MFVLMNHQLTSDQMADARESLGVNEFVYAPEEVLNIWADIPPQFNEAEVNKYLKPVRDWLNSVEKCDIALVQGEITAVVQIVRWLEREKSIKCIAATTRRDTIENVLPDGSTKKTAVFKHVRFRYINP